jgi:hypothetical protein
LGILAHQNVNRKAIRTSEACLALAIEGRSTGLRIAVWNVLGWLGAGMTEDRFLNEHPTSKGLTFLPCIAVPPRRAAERLG